MTDKHYRIAAAIIYGGGHDENFERMIRSLSPWVEGVFINYNGTGAAPSQPKGTEFKDYVAKQFAWEDNFGKARNQSFELVPKDQYDWILWIDHDDELVGGDKLQAILNSLDPSTQGVFLRYDYGIDPVSGQVLVEQWRERLLRTDCQWVWNYTIHEVCHGPPATQYAHRDDAHIKHNRSEASTDTATRERNRRILMRSRQQDPNQPRYIYYLANEIYAESYMIREAGGDATEMLVTACELYKDFLDRSSWQDDSYVANQRRSECLLMLGKHNEAIDSFMQNIKVYPDWPDAYIGVARVFMELGDHAKCEHWANACLKLSSKPKTTHVQEPLNLEYVPRLLRGIARENQDNFEGALKDYKRCYELNPNTELSNKIVRLSSGQPQTAAVVANPAAEQRKVFFGSKPDRSIAFVTAPSFEVWNPEQMKREGLGGAETCICELAPKFAADGWRVVVFGTPGDYKGIHDGVEWYDSNDFSPLEPFTVLVSSRVPAVFDAEINAKHKFLWMHDVNVGDEMKSDWGSRLDQVDRVLALTNWHGGHLNRLYGIESDKIAVVPNGIKLDRFIADAERKPKRFIYASSPDRGIDVVIQMWPEIKKRHPDAELHVFYGWTAIDKILAIQDHGWLRHFKFTTQRAVEQLGPNSGVHWHDRVSQDELAKFELTCDAWLYPTYFLETFCISAIEMQAAGVAPIVNPIGSLGEVVINNFGPTESGFTLGHAYQKQYVAAIDKWLAVPEETKEDLRQEWREWAKHWTWDEAYKKWQSLIDEVEGNKRVSELVVAR